MTIKVVHFVSQKDFIFAFPFFSPRSGVEDYWTPIPANISTVGQKRPHVDILVGPRHFSHVASYLECQGVPYEVAITDLQQAIQEENIPAKEADEQLVGRPGQGAAASGSS